MNREWPKFLTTLSLKLFSICGRNSEQKNNETRMDDKMFDASNTMTEDEMPENQEPENLLATADDVCHRVKANLQERLARDNPLELKTLPVYVSCVKEALLYRSAELGETAIDLYRRNALVSAATITRSLLETIALFERLRETCAKFIKNHKKNGRSMDEFMNFNDCLRKISLCSTDQSPEAEERQTKPYEVAHLVKSLGTRYKFSANKDYAALCQFAHPNFAGCIGPFAYWHTDHVEFISDYHLSPSPENAAVFKTLLVILLCTVEKIQEGIEGLLPEFDKVCGEYFTVQQNNEN